MRKFFSHLKTAGRRRKQEELPVPTNAPLERDEGCVIFSLSDEAEPSLKNYTSYAMRFPWNEEKNGPTPKRLSVTGFMSSPEYRNSAHLIKTFVFLSSHQYETRLPECLHQMKYLKRLVLSKLQTLPESLLVSVKGLIHLEEFHFSTNHLSEVPDVISTLTNLKTLDLSYNKLTILPDHLKRLTQLEVLNLSGNEFSEVPDILPTFTNLKILNLSYNKLIDSPDRITELVNLEELSMEACRYLKSLPPGIIHLSKLKYINCGYCHSLVEPPSAVATRGLEAITQYFVDLTRTGAAAAITTVVLLGPTMAGKTSILKSLKLGCRVMTSRSNQPGDDATKVVSVDTIHLGDSSVMVVDYGGHPVYHITYPVHIRDKCILLCTANASALRQMAEEKSWRTAVQEMVIDYLSQVLLAAPSLSEPVLILTHEDELTVQQMDECEAELLKHANEMMGEISKYQQLFMEQQEVNVEASSVPDEQLTAGWFKGIELLQTSKTLFSHVFRVGDNMEGITKLQIYLQKRVNLCLTRIPKVWRNVANLIHEWGGAYMEYKMLDQKIRSEGHEVDLKLVLAYLHAAGVLLWFEHRPVLCGYIFQNLSALSDFLIGLFDHELEAVWQSKLESFTESRMFPTAESLKLAITSFQEKGIVSESFLHHCVKIHPSVVLPVQVGIELLREFRIAFGHFKSVEDNSPAFIIPFCCQSRKPATSYQSQVVLAATLEFHGLKPPAHIYHQLTVVLLNLMREQGNTWRVVRDGVFIHQDDVCVVLIHQASNHKTKLKVHSPITSVHKSWSHFTIGWRALIMQMTREWPGVLYTLTVDCAHCLLIQATNVRRETRHEWAEISQEDLRLFSQEGSVTHPKTSTRSAPRITCRCGEDNVPYLLRFPPDGDQKATAEQIQACVKFHQDNTRPSESNVQQVPIQVQQTPTHVQQLPAQAQQTPAQMQQAPINVQQIPAQVQQAPIQMQQTPAQMQPTPVVVQQTLTQVQQVYPQVQQTPAQVNQTLIQAQQAPAQVQQALTQLQQAPAQVQHAPAQVQQASTQVPPTPSQIQHLLAHVQQAPASGAGHQAPASGVGQQSPAGAFTSSVNDTIDARLINDFYSMNSDSDIYWMSSPKRGRCLIINNTFRGTANVRHGSLKDQHDTERLFINLYFDVKVITDCENMHAAIQEETQHADHELYQAFSLVIMTHGGRESLMNNRGENEEKMGLWKLLETSKFRKMRGKPKLVIVQACSGGASDSGHIQTDDPGDPTPPSTHYTNHQDILIVMASYPGHVSYRDIHIGTFFIQNLVSVFSEYACTEHVLDLITMVKRRVVGESTASDVCQTVTTVIGTLVKKFYLYPGLHRQLY